MTTSEQAALLAKHQPYPPNKLPLAGGMRNCRGCSEGRGMAGGIGWPCDVHRMAELKDAEIAQVEELRVIVEGIASYVNGAGLSGRKTVEVTKILALIPWDWHIQNARLEKGIVPR